MKSASEDGKEPWDPNRRDPRISLKRNQIFARPNRTALNSVTWDWMTGQKRHQTWVTSKSEAF